MLFRSIVIGHQGEKIKEIVGMYFPDDSRIRFVDYQEAAGKGGPGVSIYCGIPQDIGEEPILILLSDIVVKIEEFLPSDTSWISVQRVPDWERWCMVEIGETVRKFHDKPKEKPPTDLAVSGVYYFTDASRFRFCMIDAIHGTRAGEVQISSAMSRYMKDHEIITPSFKIIDFGTLEEYLQNRGIKNSRSFNNLKPDWNGSTIVKSSKSNASKIHAEVNWYENLPTPIKIMTPRIFNKNLYSIHPSYTMERIDSPTLRELYLYLESDPKFWSDVFDKLFNVTDQFKQFYKPGKSKFFQDVATKNYERYSQINPKLANKDDLDFLQKFSNMADAGEFDIFPDSLYHGDMCFSNIFYHPGSKQIRLIDPRGEAYGNILYDLAKITHSAYYP